MPGLRLEYLNVLGNDRRPYDITIGQCPVIAKLGEEVAASRRWLKRSKR
jgi:hypothetical protein